MRWKQIPFHKLLLNSCSLTLEIQRLSQRATFCKFLRSLSKFLLVNEKLISLISLPILPEGFRLGSIFLRQFLTHHPIYYSFHFISFPKSINFQNRLNRFRFGEHSPLIPYAKSQSTLELDFRLSSLLISRSYTMIHLNFPVHPQCFD